MASVVLDGFPRACSRRAWKLEEPPNRNIYDLSCFLSIDLQLAVERAQITGMQIFLHCSGTKIPYGRFSLKIIPYSNALFASPLFRSRKQVLDIVQGDFVMKWCEQPVRNEAVIRGELP
jgi:hypothetical protein